VKIGRAKRPPGLSSDVALRMCLPSGPGPREAAKTIAGRIAMVGYFKRLDKKNQAKLMRLMTGWRSP